MVDDESPRWLDEQEQRVWRDWLAVGALLGPALNQALQRDSELSLPDFDVLVTLTESDEGRIRVAALARALQWERSRVSHHVTRMERRGLVAREECADDGRGAWVVVTAAGRAAIERAAPGHVETVRALVLDPLDDADLAALGVALAKVRARLAQATQV